MSPGQYQGNPCKRGHTGIRWRGNGGCVECHRPRRNGWRVKDPERSRAAARAEYHAGPRRQYYNWRKYGISPDFTEAHYQELATKQGGTCAMCGAPPKRKRLAVDHDHCTGRVRGLLCGPCNTTIGRWENRYGLGAPAQLTAYLGVGP